MTDRLREEGEEHQRQAEGLAADLKEALAQQAATSEILRIISRSPSDVQPVFDAIVAAAVRLLRTDLAFVMRTDGTTVTPVAGATPSGRIEEMVPGRRVDPEEHFPSRAIVSKATLQCPDWSQLELPPHEQAIHQRFGIRSSLYLPMMRNHDCLGVLTFACKQPRDFTPREVALAESFRDQAVIAIENSRLFEEVQAKTRELEASLEDLKAAQSRLIQAEKLASLGQLTAGIAHEIKNPLNFVNNFADLSTELVGEIEDVLAAARNDLDPKVRTEVEDLSAMLKSNLAKVVQHGRRADSIVKNMLAHSREGGGERRMVDANAAVNEALNLAYHGARAENPGLKITLERVFDPDAGQIAVFPQEFTRVLLNLFSNGFHAANKKLIDDAPAGFEPVLRVTTKAYADRIKIKVKDNGTGIPDAAKARVFEPFFTTKPAGEGTGLGLSLSHDIVVKMHGGRIDVMTEPGKFTEMTVTLPRNSPA